MIRRKYGIKGHLGPAPGFAWDEVRCSDGTPCPEQYRDEAVRQARYLNQFRKTIAKRYKVRKSAVSIHPNSWYRSPSFNRQIGGALNSQHLYGKATDIRVYVTLKNRHRVQLNPSWVAKLAARVPAFRDGGIGWYDAAHGSFTHLDHRAGRSRWVNG